MMLKKPFLPLNLQFFAADNGGGGEEPTSNQTGDNNEPTNPEPTNPTPSKTFTQEELDGILKDRLERERKKYSDYEELIKFKTEAEKKAEEERLAKLDEIERAKEEARKAQEDAEKSRQEIARYQEQIKQEKIRNEFIKQATQKNVQYIDDALILVQHDLSRVTVDSNGQIQGMNEILDNLVATKPFLVKKATTPPVVVGETTNTSSTSDTSSLEEQLQEAKKKKDFAKVVELSNKIKNLIK